MVENMELVAGETEGGGGVNTVLMYPQKNLNNLIIILKTSNKSNCFFFILNYRNASSLF